MFSKGHIPLLVLCSIFVCVESAPFLVRRAPPLVPRQQASPIKAPRDASRETTRMDVPDPGMAETIMESFPLEAVLQSMMATEKTSSSRDLLESNASCSMKEIVIKLSPSGGLGMCEEPKKAGVVMPDDCVFLRNYREQFLRPASKAAGLRVALVHSWFEETGMASVPFNRGLTLPLFLTMARDSRLWLPTIPDVLLKADFYFGGPVGDSDDRRKFYSSMPSPQFYTMYENQQDPPPSLVDDAATPHSRPGKRGGVAELPSLQATENDVLTMKTSTFLRLGGELSSNKDTNVSFEYEIMWDAPTSNCGVEFEASGGFRSRDHAPADAHGYLPHSEKATNMSKMAHGKFYRRAWPVDGLKLTQEGGRSYRSASAFLSSFVLSASAFQEGGPSSSANSSTCYFSLIRIARPQKNSPEGTLFNELRTVVEGTHRVVFDPMAVLGRDALLLGAIQPYTGALVNSTLLPLDSKLRFDDGEGEGKMVNFSQLIAIIVSEYPKVSIEKVDNLAFARPQSKHDPIDLGALLLGKEFTGRLVTTRVPGFKTALEHLISPDAPGFQLGKFASTFQGSLHLSYRLREQVDIVMSQRASDYSSVWFTVTGPATNTTPIGTMKHVHHLSKRLHAFADINSWVGGDYSVPMVFSDAALGPRRWFQLFSDPRYEWMRNFLLTKISGASPLFTIPNPFRTSIGAMFSTPISFQSSLRHRRYGLQLSPAEEHLLSQPLSCEPPVGTTVLLFEDVVSYFIESYAGSFGVVNADLSGSSSRRATRELAARLVFGFEEDFVSMCLREGCRVLAQYRGLHVSKLYFTTEGSHSACRVPVLPLLPTVAVRSRRQPENELLKTLFEEARAVMHVSAYVNGLVQRDDFGIV